MSDDQAEFQINDRLSFMRFLGLGHEVAAPNAKMIWLFRELLVEAGALDKLFDLFDRRLSEKGISPWAGRSWMVGRAGRHRFKPRAERGGSAAPA